ncbi:hypothetical protein D3C87_1716380 [compost metagenome]
MDGERAQLPIGQHALQLAGLLLRQLTSHQYRDARAQHGQSACHGDAIDGKPVARREFDVLLAIGQRPAGHASGAFRAELYAFMPREVAGVPRFAVLLQIFARGVQVGGQHAQEPCNLRRVGQVPDLD